MIGLWAHMIKLHEQQWTARLLSLLKGKIFMNIANAVQRFMVAFWMGYVIVSLMWCALAAVGVVQIAPLIVVFKNMVIPFFSGYGIVTFIFSALETFWSNNDHTVD